MNTSLNQTVKSILKIYKKSFLTIIDPFLKLSIRDFVWPNLYTLLGLLITVKQLERKQYENDMEV